MATSYCEFVRVLPVENVHRLYHDHEYGFPLLTDHALFERLVLEINQAGLSWETILKKKAGFVQAYDHFVIEKVAGYGEAERARLLADASIIRNRLKVNAAIENARRILTLREQYGSLVGWLDHHHPRPKLEWVKLFKQTFVFTGGEIVNEFLMSTGYLPGAHEADCPIHAQITTLNPAWLRV